MMNLVRPDQQSHVSPVVRQAAGDPPGSSRSKGQANTTAPTRRAFRILVVEDDWFIASEDEAVLLDANHHVVGIAATAEEAVSLADSERPDLVLMDIRLHGERDGIDAAMEIQRRFGIPSLFATAHSDPSMRERGELASPVGWLIKPFSSSQLVSAVQEALERQR